MGKAVSSALLILSCSKRKKPVNTPLPAVELYDGPAYRVVRKFLREADHAVDLDILILSAKYGFISGHEAIRSYDLRMSKALAADNQAFWRGQLLRLLAEKSHQHVFINLGSDYLAVLPDSSEFAPQANTVIVAEGRIGERLHKLKNWLNMIVGTAVPIEGHASNV